MAKIDWRARLSNKAFWLALVPTLFVLAQFVLRAAEVEIDLSEMQGKALDLVNAVFTLLAILGIVVDPSTEGIADVNSAPVYDDHEKTRR